LLLLLAPVAALQTQQGQLPASSHPLQRDESFYILEGEITALIGDQTIRGTPGTLIFGPRGVPHSFEIHSDPVRMLILLTRPAWKATSRSSARRAGADSATAGGDSIRRHTKPDCRCVEVRDCECSAQALKGSVVARIAPLGRPGAPSSTVQFSGSGATEIVLDGSRVRYSG